MPLILAPYTLGSQEVGTPTTASGGAYALHRRRHFQVLLALALLLVVT